MAGDDLKRRAQAAVEAHWSELAELSLRIHAHPEVGYEEFQAAAWLTAYLERQGFNVERGCCGLSTAFKASYGSGPPVVALLAEYDALPGLGHACGHNIIAASAVGGGVAARGVVDEVGGTVQVLGTPAEEKLGGKLVMIEKGGFEGIDAALILHPSGHDSVRMATLAAVNLEVEFFGRAAHASSRPQDGVNALEALLFSYAAINGLRQHVRNGSRIHGVITDGGRAPNIVPEHSAGSFMVRARDDAYLDDLMRRVLACFEAGAQATGARLEHRWLGRCNAVRTNRALADLFKANLESLGRQVDPVEDTNASSDMGNVTLFVPGIHPTIAIAPPETPLHSVEFAKAAASESGERGLRDGAKALAMTVADLLSHPEALKRVKEEFSQADAAA